MEEVVLGIGLGFEAFVEFEAAPVVGFGQVEGAGVGGGMVLGVGRGRRWQRR